MSITWGCPSQAIHPTANNTTLETDERWKLFKKWYKSTRGHIVFI